MPEMKNLDEVWRFTYPIVNQEGRVNQSPNVGLSLHRVTYVRESLEDVEMVQHRIAKFFGGRGKVSPGIGEYFLKIC